ncbi:hypothetical protein MAR_029584 [Mya arenaria]|uniref:Uncharacterized protein n=1 Tax=Mya arenaria TaxID=6604 RepID=A0ABY7DHU9_MYAAR|nr:hypothetical protein MAR_029584 [Mya arenaria]
MTDLEFLDLSSLLPALLAATVFLGLVTSPCSPRGESRPPYPKSIVMRVSSLMLRDTPKVFPSPLTVSLFTLQFALHFDTKESLQNQGSIVKCHTTE